MTNRLESSRARLWRVRLWLAVGAALIWVAACTAPPPPAPDTPVAMASVAPTTVVAAEAFDTQGHRGARGLVPENTLPSFETALDLGVTTLEADLHLTADGVVVVWHDPIVDKAKCRLPDGVDAPDPRNPLRRVFISQQPLATVQAYRCDLNPDPGRFPDQAAPALPLAGDDYRIPTLEALFAFVDAYADSPDKTEAQRANAASVRFNIETKRVPDQPENIGDGFTGGAAGPFELAILELVEAYGLHDRVTIQSFDHRSLRVIREIDATISLAALTTGGEAKLRVYRGYGFDVWSPNARDVTAELVAEAHDLGLQVIPWTVNESDAMVRLIEMGVDGLISDYPDRLLAVVGR